MSIGLEAVKTPYEEARESKILHAKNAREIRQVIRRTELGVTKIMSGLNLLMLPIIKHPYSDIELTVNGVETALQVLLLALDLQADKHEQRSKDYSRKAKEANCRLYKAVESMCTELKQ